MVQPHFSATAGNSPRKTIYSSPATLADVLEIFVVGDGQVGGQCPRVVVQMRMFVFWLADDGEFHIDALADVVLIFHFGFGQRGAAGDAPINRFFAAINEAFLDDVREEPQFIGFVFLVQCEIGVFPIAEYAEALELHSLQVDVLAGIGLAGLAELAGIGRVGLAAGRVFAHFLGNLEFNRQAVAIPAGDVGR